MSLKLPTYSDTKRTLSAWANELRSAGIVVCGRNISAKLPYCRGASQEWEPIGLDRVGEGWTTYNPSVFDDDRVSTIAVTTQVYSKYQIVANSIHYQFQLALSITVSGIDNVYPVVSLPVNIVNVPSPTTLGRSVGWCFVDRTCFTLKLFRESTTLPWRNVYVDVPTGHFSTGSYTIFGNVLAEIE